MKKSLLVFSMTSLLLVGSMNFAMSQEQPQPKKDSVNMDNTAKPTFYYAIEDEKSETKEKSPLIPIIAGGLVVVAAGIFFLTRKKKK
jgi:LPXTG-motif cell wall-anchored protein